MKKKIKLILFVLATVVVFSFVLAACDKSGDSGENDESGFPKHNITVESTADCAVSVDKTQAEFAETVTITLDLKVFDKYVERVTYNGKNAAKRSENTYDFLMGNDDVVVKVELKSYQEVLSDSRKFATFSSSNTTTLAKNNGKVDLKIALNGSYMTILNWNVRSTNQNAIPGASEKTSYGTFTESGAISAKTSTGSSSNIITELTISVDTDEIQNGETFLLIDLVNGNSTSQKASLVVKLTVSDSIVTTKWTETLVFDVSDLPSSVRRGFFKIQLIDYDFVSGSDNQELQTFNIANSDGANIEVTIEYVKGHRYYVSIFSVGDGGVLTGYALSDKVGSSGTSETGFNKIEKNFMTLLSDGLTFEITVRNETVR